MLTVLTHSHDPFYNQAFEEFVFETFRDDDVFLLWQNSPTVIVGSYQNICREVHVDTLRKLGIPIVRRMTGGGTVYHDLGNVNYTYITNQDGPLDYDRCLEPVIEALNGIGVLARKNRTCDIAIGDQKISGSAQRAAGGRLLHHGALLFQSDLAVLDQITTHHKNDCFQSKGTVSAICPVTNIADHLPSPMDAETFKECMVRHIMGGSDTVYEITPEDDQRIREIAAEKFNNWERIYGADPKFNIERTGRLAGGKMQFKIDVQKGVIQSAAVYGDFFSTLDGSTICAALAGCRYERSAVLEALKAHGIDGAVYRISAREMAEVIAD